MHFELLDQNNQSQKIPSPNSKLTVLVFYPKDNTPACSSEISEFARLRDEFNELNTAIFGISGPGDKKKFAEKTGCSFPLLTDEGFELSKQFGVYKDKKFMGRTYKGIERTTIILDKSGQVVKRFDKVKPQGHADQVLSFIRGL